MQRVLNVAEKPSASREISNVLARASRTTPTTRPSGTQYISNVDFCMPFRGATARMTFTSVLGHLMSTDIEERYRKWGGCDPGLLLDDQQCRVEWTVSDDKRGIAQNLRSESRAAQVLVLWLDCDSEGEKIAHDVANVCKSANRSLTVWRAKFSAMTHVDLMRACNNLVSVDQKLVDMVSTRQEIDLRAGAAYTRFLTVQTQRFDLHSGQDGDVVSYGPCQFPTLGLVVDRWLTITHFQKHPFWVIDLALKDCTAKFDWMRGRIFDEYTAHTLFELCVEESRYLNETARVERVHKRTVTRRKPLPLSTVELQKIASRTLRISSDRTMVAAEKLYTKGLISYPRTETDRFDPSYDLRALVDAQVEHAPWAGFAQSLRTPVSPDSPVTFQWPANGANDDHAHPPIHPTSSRPGSFESPDEQKVFDYVARRFLASCSLDAKGAETQVHVRVGSSEWFRARGLVVESPGYLDVMAPYERWAGRDMPATLLEVGKSVPIAALNLRRSETQPPPLLSEADLISLMDRHGIGTDATIAEHIKKVQDRKYVTKNREQRFEPSKLGIALVEALEKCQILLARPSMRSSQERALREISAGTKDAAAVKRQSLDEFTALFHQLRSNANRLDQALALRFQSTSLAGWDTVQHDFSRCGACSSLMQLKQQGDGHRAKRALVCAQCGTFMMPHRGTLEPVAGPPCPLCQFQVVRVLNNETNRSHTVCPYCITHPPATQAANPERVSSDFRCFKCAQDGCPYASGTPASHANVARCPKCASPCSIRTWPSQDGSTVFKVACRDWSSCKWSYTIPDAAASVQRGDADDRCVCGSARLRIEWKSSCVPPGGSRSFYGCIWCDPGFRSVLADMDYGDRFPRLPHPGAPQVMDLEDIRGSRSRGHTGSRRAIRSSRARGIRARTTRGRRGLR